MVADRGRKTEYKAQQTRNHQPVASSSSSHKTETNTETWTKTRDLDTNRRQNMETRKEQNKNAKGIHTLLKFCLVFI